jgi:predicted nucleic acid-binding protein
MLLHLLMYRAPYPKGKVSFWITDVLVFDGEAECLASAWEQDAVLITSRALCRRSFAKALHMINIIKKW